MLFPSKDKTTWEGFHKPFIKGDIVSTENGVYIGIVKFTEDNHNCNVFCSINDNGYFFVDNNFLFNRLATKKEKQKLFDAIKANSYKWNPETKTLEKLPKFKVGDRVKHISAYTSGIVVRITDKGYHIDYPKGEGVCYINFELEKYYELAPNKFDITTLKAFESRVLVRDKDNEPWSGQFFSHIGKNSDKPFVCIGVIELSEYRQCIPYENNEHLLGTSNDCDDYYKTWEK